MNIIRNLVPQERYHIKCPYRMDAEFCVVHNTGNDAPATNEVAYMIRNDNKVSFHYAVDDVQVVQGIPESRNAWHCGDGVNGAGNRKGIGIEICYSLSGGERFAKAEANAAKFIAELLYGKGWSIDRVRKHQNFNDKYCPHRTLDLGWPRFLAMVQAELDALTTGFVDVPLGVWYTGSVVWAVNRGITEGVDAEHFAPERTCSRAEAITLLWRATGRPNSVISYAPFFDVPVDAYYAEAANWAYREGISFGTDAGEFSPEAPCTRAHVITFLWRALGSHDPEIIDPNVQDVPEGSFYHNAVHWALEQKITVGVDFHHFAPAEPCTRAQIVTMLHRAFGN